jgi:hypothetical protein
MNEATAASLSRAGMSWASTSSVAASSSDQRSVNSSFRTWSLDLK